ncbi:MAG: cyanophycin synthetase [Thermoplasmatota archaeon]
MEILQHRALRGPNFYARFPVTYMLLDIGDLEESPSDEIPGLPDRIKELMPSLIEHRCSPGVRGGFFQRLDRGTWAGHIVEHLAIELQNLAGMDVGFGKTRETTDRGVYSVVYKHLDESCGLRAGEMAVSVLQSLIEDEPVDLEPLVQELRELREANLFGPSTGSIVAEAASRNIPFQRMNSASHIMLGQGHNQKAIQASMTGATKARGVAIAADKEWTKTLLDEAGISVPKGRSVGNVEDALRVAKKIGYPVVAKPLDANHGRGITTDITSDEELEIAFASAKKHHDRVVIERFLLGKDHRLLVINSELVAAARRDPAHVMGDGKQTVQALIDEVNADPRRGFGHEKMLTMIHVDNNTHRMLDMQELNLDSIPKAGREVVLKSTANLSTGGTATDVTDEVHPSIRFMATRIARMVDLDIMGIDIVAPHLREPLEETGGGIVEVNAGPGLRMHLEPTHGPKRNVAANIVDMMFPEGDGRIPTVAVTGTNGKTTTVRLISHILKLNGERVGMAATGSVEIENQVIMRGDYSGPLGAQAVLRDRSVTAGVLEVARGGILRRGMGVDKVDVGVLLNIGRDHIGEGDIHDLEDLLRLKSTVVDVAGVPVLNVDDPLVLSWHEARNRSTAVLCTQDPNHPALASANNAVTVQNDAIVLQHGDHASTLAPLVDVPLTMSGRAKFNVENCLAAVGACVALGVNEETIRAGLQTFNSTPGQNPGRMNRFDLGDIRVLVDFGHNAAAIRALDDVLPHLKPRPDGRILRVAYLAGNRLDEDLRDLGAALAKNCDKLWVSDPDPRGRAEGATSAVIASGARDAGLASVATAIAESDNFDACFAEAQPGDLLVFQCEDHEGLMKRIRRMQEAP